MGTLDQIPFNTKHLNHTKVSVIAIYKHAYPFCNNKKKINHKKAPSAVKSKGRYSSTPVPCY